MLEEIKKGLISGLGAIFLTKDKIERITRKMVDEAKISKEDAQNLKEDLYKTGEKEWSDLEEFFSGIIKKIMNGLDLCSRKDMDELKGRVEELEKRLAIQELKNSVESPRIEREI
ncbi:MAG: phasin family protein [Candidatus Aminicenantes bacterium]|nr:phasin family protein [Candidatus Aminicenantes bacterium]